MPHRLAIATVAALRAVLIFGEAGFAETWRPEWAGWMRRPAPPRRSPAGPRAVGALAPGARRHA